MHTTAAGQLAQFQQTLDALRSDTLSVAALSQSARSHTTLLQALPPRYAEVLHNLLDRLESSALFSEESCSFSQKDLLDSLQMWCDKAHGQLGANA